MKGNLLKKCGFTMVEIVITVLLLQILAFVAIQTYTRTMERGRGDNAAATLRLIRAAQRMYTLDYSVFSDDLNTLVANEYLLDPNTAPARDRGFNYLTDNSEATATRISGQFAGDSFSLGHDGTWDCSGGWPFCPP